MHNEQVERRIRTLLAGILGIPPEGIPLDAHIMSDLGADSWQYLEFRTELEKHFGILISDAEVDRLASLRECAALVGQYLFRGRGDLPQRGAVRHRDDAGHRAERTLREDGTYYWDIEVGVSLMGRNNLGETPLMKLLGEIRWNHIAAFTKVPSKLLVDETGDRLYATFYYVEIQFPRETPMASFGENDRLTTVNTLRSYGNSIMDGYTFLYPAAWPMEKKIPLLNGPQALEAGIPYIRSSNIFVKMLQGAAWLKKSRPCQPGVDNIPKTAEVPATYALIKKASEEGRFRAPPPTATPLTAGKVKVTYQIEPDQDLNGLGLLYFASYPMILDIAERRVLPEMALLPIGHELLDLRTVVSRQSAYLSNAHQSDSIEVFLEAWIDNPFLSGHPAPETYPVRLFFNYEMFRCSDRRKMMVSDSEKVIFGRTLEEAGLLDRLEEAARKQGPREPAAHGLSR